MSTTMIRGNTQIIANSVTDGQVNATIIVAAGGNAFTGDQSMGGHKLTNLATPTTGTDATNKTYVDNLINGKDWKQSCRAASTANVTISSAPSSLDGVSLAAGDRVLLKNQTTASENGIYVFTSAGAALTRAADADTGELTSGATTFITEGTVNVGKEYTLSTADPITVGTTSLTFTQSNASSTYSGDETSIHLSGTVFSAIFGTTSGTVCQGNDSRLSDARTPVGTALSSAQIWVGTAGNVAAAVTLSGDVTISNAGVATVVNQVKISKYIVRETPTGTINGSNAAFILANTPVSGTEQVFVNGLLQDAGSGNDYTISTTTITFQSGAIPQTGDKIRVTYIST